MIGALVINNENLTNLQIKSKSSIDCTARCCIPHTIALVVLEKNFRLRLDPLR